ncbi:hypothetical protein ID866_2969 [Astraeus odoratus]|nr:hypothetical protein ID866_2969 [Astraeus odoratus]
MSSNQPHLRWQETEDHEITVDLVLQVLAAVDNDLWVVAACTDRLMEDVNVQRALLDLGISRTDSAVERASYLLLQPDSRGVKERLSAYFTQVPEDAQLLQMRAVLLDRLDRLSSFVEICQDTKLQEEGTDDIDDEWEDDPWANDADKVSSTEPNSIDLYVPLPEFLTKNLVELALFFATKELYPALRTLTARHGSILWPFRFTILKGIPPHSPPSEYADILPGYDVNQDVERRWSREDWRTSLDYVELPEVRAALQGLQILSDMGYNCDGMSIVEGELLKSSELTDWYRHRVDDVISWTGMIDIALAIVQHGASLAVPDLDKLGEDLSLLARLVYDVPQPDESTNVEDWTLERWKSMEPAQVVNSYLAYSTPETVAADISRLVMPYLFVLEARSERAGQADPGLASRLLYDYVLSSRLPIVAAIFEMSKPTLSEARRIIRNDEDTARLALACLYGSDSRDEWSTMSLIFECLPAWDIAPDGEDEADEANTTIVSLGAFVTPSTTHHCVSAADLFIFFKPLPVVSLSRALDILDVHIKCGEVLSRWNVPVPLRWFLQSATDADEQRSWANRMARRVGSPASEMRNRDVWEWLLEDMKWLRAFDENGIKGAFGLLSEEEISSIFLGGLLSLGLFDIAHELLQKRGNLSLSATAVESICLSVSRELYDNASSGNYKVGDMKLAYDCLTVPPPSERINIERDFIEATSRLSSFNISSRPGVHLSPIEIRLTKDRLSLISRVLSSTADAYKHTQVILDLLYKLGYRGDVVAEVKTLAMLSDTALQAEDFTRAYETSKKMIDLVLNLRSCTANWTEDPAVREACEVCWVACYQLGRQPEFHDVEKKLELVGHALGFCPADKLNDVLTSWCRLQKENLDTRREYLACRSSVHQRRPSTPSKPVSSLQARLKDLHVPVTPFINAEDAAALAGRAFNRVASNFPFAVGGRGRSGSSGDDARSRSRDGSRIRLDGEDVSAQAGRVLQRGIGWLLGADDES